MIRWGEPVLSIWIAGAFLALLTVVWVLLAASVGRWAQGFRLGPGAAPSAPAPKVSILIPARDEAGKIGPCVRAALASGWPALEVVVVDDGSTDGTGDEARAAGAGDARLRVIEGSPLPRGWAGKPWACLRAAGESTGALLLFIDADVRLAPWAVPAAVGALVERRLALLSLFGDWELVGFWEKAVIPVVGWFIRGAVDLRAVNDPGREEAFANGQFILVERSAYERVDGHGAVRAAVLDDVYLARAFKRRALACGLLYAPGAFEVRLYTSLAEIVRGYTKNLYEGMGRRPLLAFGAILFIGVSTLLPHLTLAVMLLSPIWPGWRLGGPGWIAWVAGICALIHVFRWRVERADGRSGWHALTHPLGNLVFVWILLRSVFGVESRWKGRRFVDGNAA